MDANSGHANLAVQRAIEYAPDVIESGHFKHDVKYPVLPVQARKRDAVMPLIATKKVEAAGKLIADPETKDAGVEG